MEDSASVKSNDSTAISDEYEFVSGVVTTLPLLKISTGSNLEELMGEVLREMDVNEDNVDLQQNNESVHKNNVIELKRFETCEHPLNEEDIQYLGDVPQDCTIFGNISYLGAASISGPKSDTEVKRNMAILNEQCSSIMAIEVSVSIPSCSEGCVVLHDAGTNGVMAKYEINRILFYSHGIQGTRDASCFAFTWSHGDSIENAIFQCHVFRCNIPEAVAQVSQCFVKAFNLRMPKSLTTSVNGELVPNNSKETYNRTGNLETVVFEVSMEIKEEDGRSGFVAVPKDKTYFKLRANVQKQICLTVQQVCDNDLEQDLEVERCFGVLVSHGRNVKHSDMQLLEMVSMGSGVAAEKKCYLIIGQWNPMENAFESLNVETPRDTKVFLTVAVDLVIRGISEPVRLPIETPVKVFPHSERFWSFSRRPLIQQFTLDLKEISDRTEVNYEVVKIERSEPPVDLDRNRLNLTLNNLASFIHSPSVTSMDALTPKEDYASDGDEPMLSGTGEVSKDCSKSELDSWADVLVKWSIPTQHPRQLAALVKQGIPEALRGEVWQRLAHCDQDSSLMDNYRILISQDCSCENVIQRDINRTFPAHDFFKEAGGLGQDSLFRISKAYAVYDTEVGYCQGLSFLAATLLLHMPEEQAFCVLLKLMYNYGLRDLYKDGFECLYLRLFQLNRLMQEHVPQLLIHFSDKGVESHMFASQWFLTLFTARFPLYFVFHIIDVFLLQGTETLFQIALALLITYKKDLLQLDFESILKYFRVSLPKKCRNEETAKQLMKLACSLKVKKLKKYEQEFMALKARQDSEQNDEQYAAEAEKLKYALLRSEEEKQLLEQEVVKVKDILKREVKKAENDSIRNSTIIAEYKQICQRLDSEQLAAKTSLNQLKKKVAGCEKCSEIVTEEVSQNENEEEATLTRYQERIKELELDLARAKLAQVEAECQNQDLTHQLNETLTELQSLTSRNSWPPWLHKTLSSIKEVAINKSAVPRRDSNTTDPMSREDNVFSN
uniref:Rab-GAP TBC domain-containing protein n=4 Tax=Clastoptera arizonana TaxID=38151 RepID=A0A1B6CKT3_9HEMI